VRTNSTIGRSCSSGHRTRGIRQGPRSPDLTVIQPHFDTERLAWVGFDLAQVLNDFIQISIVARLSPLIRPDLDVADRTRSSRSCRIDMQIDGQLALGDRRGDQGVVLAVLGTAVPSGGA
jgi:hypothetical protein